MAHGNHQYLNAVSLDLLHCGHPDQTRTPLVHSLQFHLRLKAVGCTLVKQQQMMVRQTLIKLVRVHKHL